MGKESHQITFIRNTDETTSDSEADQINDNEQSDTEPDLTLDEIFAFSKRLKKYAIVKDDNFLGVAQDLNLKCETAILQRCLKKKQVSVVDFFLNVNLVKLDNREYGEHVVCTILMLYK
jgi:hypothetical protein